MPDADWSNITFGKIPNELGKELNLLDKIPTPHDFGIYPEKPGSDRMIRWSGGEKQALVNLENRLIVEAKAFYEGYYLPNQANPDLLGPPTSLSAALRHGCLSVRLFYWKIHDLYQSIHGNLLPATPYITGQLIWREYFYTMSVNNPFYAEMERNEICLNIPWDESKKGEENLTRWKNGQTGFPFIDAIMRQLLLEGWIHHVARNASACFLTRGDLWISWEKGLNYFLKYLLDADWSVCAGNWMWVSSSAFEQLLDCSQCICPVNFGRRLDPDGEYIRRYVPELRQLPIEYLYEPWCAPLEVQQRANCVIGRDYPQRMVDHKQASSYNRRQMEKLRESLRERPAHCCPSNEEETRQFMWLADSCRVHNLPETIAEEIEIV